MVVRIRPPTCGLPVAILELVVYRDPTGCLTAFYFSPFEVRDDSNPSGDGLPHLSRFNLGGAATPSRELFRGGSVGATSFRSCGFRSRGSAHCFFHRIALTVFFVWRRGSASAVGAGAR